MSVIKGRSQSKKKKFLVIQNFVKAVRGLNLNHIDEALLIDNNIDYEFLMDNDVLTMDKSYYLDLFENSKNHYSVIIVDYIIAYDANKLNEIPDKDIFDGGKMKVDSKKMDVMLKTVNSNLFNFTYYEYFILNNNLYNVSEKGAVFMRKTC